MALVKREMEGVVKAARALSKSRLRQGRTGRGALTAGDRGRIPRQEGSGEVAKLKAWMG